MSNAEASGKLDVLVVGAGPVGLMLAVLCERCVHALVMTMAPACSSITFLMCGTGRVVYRYGLSVRVVEKSLERMPYSKAFGLHARSVSGDLSLRETSLRQRLLHTYIHTAVLRHALAPSR